jgi:spore germination protein GerM
VKFVRQHALKASIFFSVAVFCAALGFLVASCGADDASSAGPIPDVGDAAATATAETSTGPEVFTETGEAEVTETTATDAGEEAGAPEAPDPTVTYEVWFAHGETLFVTYRTQDRTPRVGTAALEALVAGPNEYERGYGLTSAIPEGTELLGLTIEEGIAHVDLTSEFESGGGALSMQMRLAQVVYTLRQFPTVKGVVFSLDGKPIDVLGGEGVVIDEPLSRRDFRDLLPAILVTHPGLGQTFRKPAVVFGSANVFEANVTIELLDASGREIFKTFTTATCGSGCRGTFGAKIRYVVDEEQPGTIVVHDDDAAGVGRPPHEVRIPVILTPGA